MSAAATAAPSTAANDAHRAVLDRLFGKITDVMSLPAVAQQIVQLASSESTSTEELRQAIQRDVGLTTKIMRRVNSAYYGLRNPVNELEAAITLLGFQEIRNLALTVFTSKMFEKSVKHKGYTREGLWNHCVAVGAVSRLVSNISRRAVPGEAYVAGQMHDLGLVLLEQNLPKQFNQVLDQLDEHTPTTIVEKQLYTFDHAELGAYACQKWKFAESTCDAVRWHHQPQLYTGPHRDLVYVVAIANSLCSQAGRTSLGVANISPIPHQVYTNLGLDERGIEAIHQELEPTLEKAGIISAV